MFTVYLDGEAKRLVDSLGEKAFVGALNRDEKEFYRKLRNALKHLESNPRHPGLNSNEISALTKKHGVKIWESYLENKRSGARRMFWIYGPETREITVIGIERHPEPGRGYARVSLAKDAIQKTSKMREK